MPKTILQINTVINFNATGRIAEEIGLVATRHGWNSYIAYGRNTRESASKLIKIGSDFSFRMHVLQNRLLDNHGSGSIVATHRLIKAIQAVKPDLIQLHNIHGYYLNIKLLLEYLATTNIPIVWTLHDCWAFTGHCAYFDYAECDKWKTLCFKCPQKDQYPKSWFLDRSEHNYNLKKQLTNGLKNLHLVTVSDWQANLVKQSFLKHKPISVIHNGIDLTTFRPKSDLSNIRKHLNISDSEMVLLGLASIWEPRKGLQDYIKLSKLLGQGFRIVLVGLTDAQRKSLPPSVTGLKRTENIQQLAELYSLATLFLNLTYEDNYPTTNLESLACGTPVLTYKTGGSIESVDQETGFIVEKGDLASVVRICNIVREKGKMFYSSECRSKAEHLFDKKDSFEKYFELYEKLLF